MEKQRNFRMQGKGTGAAIMVKISPRARKNEITEIQLDGCVKIKITAPPVDGKANIELISFLAKIFGIGSNKIEIISGQTGHLKIISIMGLTTEEVNKTINEQLK
jgi:uncharacterized protein